MVPAHDSRQKLHLWRAVDTPKDPVSIAAADLNGDGLFDLASANRNSGDVTVFFQRGPGSFDPDPLVLTDPRARVPRSVYAADLDGDGRTDLVSANQATDNLAVHLNHLRKAFR